MEDDEAAEIRRKNLNAYCVKRGWVSQKDNSKGSPSELSRMLGRGVAFWSNLLRDPKKSFGPTLAREIEKNLSLPKYFLEGEAVQSNQLNIAPPDQTNQSGNITDVFEKDSKLTDKVEIEILKMQAVLAQKETEIARKEAETAKVLARAEIAEAKLEILKPMMDDFQLVRDLLKRTEARLTETEKVLNEMQEEMINIKKNRQRAA